MREVPRERRTHRASVRRQQANDFRAGTIPVQDVVTAVPSRRKTILVVEDDPALLAVYKTTLMLEGFEVTTAPDGIDALHRIEQCSPDLIVLDLGLPRLSGFDVRAEIAAHAETRHIPILVVTGQSEVDDAGFACVLKKPVYPEALVSAVDDCLRRWPPFR